MAKLGSNKRPAIVRVKTAQRGQEIMALCQKHGWQVVVGIEPDKNEDVSDVKNLLTPPKPVISTVAKIRRNDPCSCGSGKKYKKCCLFNPKITDGNDSKDSDFMFPDFKENVYKHCGEAKKIQFGKSETKMSDIIFDFAKEILDRAASIEEEIKAIRISILSWNVSFFNEEKQQISFMNDTVKKMNITDPLEISDFKAIMTSLIKRKNRFYSDINRIIVYFEVKNINNSVVLNVASSEAGSKVSEGF